MASNRAAKSGFAAEAKAKTDGKYDEKVAAEVMMWIASRVRDPPVNRSPKPDDVYETLRNGLVLARLLKSLNIPIKDSLTQKPQTLAFKQMEVISQCNGAMQKYGVSDTELFQTVDLSEKQNMWQVILSLAALSRKAMQHGHQGIGPKESQTNIRHFSDQQLRSGQNVIGLQMGTNKGANQAGMTFGKPRFITD